MTSSAPPLHVVPGPSVPPALLRRTMGHFATGVSVVTARDRAGRSFGTTANSLTSVSLEPPLLLVCLNHGSETLAALRDAGRFAVNILRADQRALSDRFARRADPRTWLGVRHRVVDGLPLLDDALATLECDVEETVAAGDHLIVIGRVTAADHAEDDGAPLLYLRGRYAALGDARPARDAAPRPADVRLPSELGDLRITHLAGEDDGPVRVAVTIGEPRGTRGALVHLHRGCLLGDVFGSTACRGREILRAALALMGPGTPGVVVYHRDGDGLEGCCGGDAPAPEPSEAEIATVRRAMRELRLREVRLVGTAAEADALIAAGVRVSALVTT